MFKVELLADSIADKLAYELKYDKDKKEVIAYGAFALLQTLISIILVSLFGWIFNVALEALTISIVVSILRKYSGGVHATTSDACTIIGTAVFLILAKILSYLVSYIDLVFVIPILLSSFLWCFYIVFKLAPVESPNKKLSSSKKARMKKRSIITLSVYFILTALFTVLYFAKQKHAFLLFSLSISIGSVWQMYTLTNSGHLWLSKIDSILNHFLNKRRG